MKVCNTCEKKFDDNSHFCPVDGTRLIAFVEDPLGALIGKTLNRTYCIEAKLGQGAMGAVFRAKHIGIGDLVAIKVISPQHTQNQEIVKRFRREAQAVRRLSHPNAVAVHDFNFTEDGLLFMVMEHVKGVTLEDSLKEVKFFAPKRALEILRPIAAALDVAHSLGIIHRDLKPANLMLCHDRTGQEQVKVLDFGTARLSHSDDDPNRSSIVRITSQGQICGTPVYMSPEQAMDEPITTVSDIYSMGIVLYQMLTGTVPYASQRVQEILLAHIEGVPDPPSQRRPELRPEFDAMVLKAIEKKPENRYQTAGEMAEELATTIAAVARDQYLTTKAAGDNATIGRIIDDIPSQLRRSDVRRGSEKRAAPELDFAQFINREAELSRLRDEYQSGCEGKARPTFILGSPGIGKTELLGQFREWASNAGALVLTGKFLDYGSSASEPLLVFKNMLANASEASAISDKQSGNQDALRSYSLPLINFDNEAVDKWQIFEQLNEAFFLIAQSRPVLILLDDLQWADSLSLDYLGYLLRGGDQLKFIFVAAGRAEEANSKGHPFREWLMAQTSYLHYEKIELAPFDVKTIELWLHSIFQSIEFSKEDINHLHNITDGNPFYLAEVIRLLVDSEKINYQDGVWRCSSLEKVKVSHSINNIVRYKLESCSEELRQLLSQAAVIGDEFQFDLLNQVSGLDEIKMENLLIAGVKSFLLKEEEGGDKYRFYQTSIRFVIYEEIPPRQRRRLHSQVADALMKLHGSKIHKVYGALTNHFFAANDWQQAFKYGTHAIEQAWQQQIMGEVIKFSHSLEEAINKLEAEEKDPERRRALGQLKVRRLMALMRLGSFEDAEREAKQNREFIEELKDPEVYLAYQGILTELSFWGNRYPEGVSIGSAGLAYARQMNIEQSACHLLFYLAMCQSRICRLSEPLATFALLNEIAERNGDRAMQASALAGLGFFNHFIGQWRKAREYFKKSLEFARACNDRYRECFTFVFWTWATEYECQAQQLEQRFQEGTKIARACGWRSLEGYFYFAAGRSLGSAIEPDLAKASEFLARGQAIMQETNDRVGQLMIAHAFATAEGRAKPSMESLTKLRSISSTLTKNGEMINNCRSWCEQGDTELKLDLWDDAFNSYQNALRLADSLPFADCLWRAHYGLARCYQHAGNDDDARTHLMMAMSVINKLQQEFDTAEEVDNFIADKSQVYVTYGALCS